MPHGGGPLGGLPYLGGLIGVEVFRAGRRASDVGGLPDTQDQRVSPGRQLGSGMRDRERGELGSVLGEEHRPGQGRGVTLIRCRETWGILGRSSRGGQVASLDLPEGEGKPLRGRARDRICVAWAYIKMAVVGLPVSERDCRLNIVVPRMVPYQVLYGYAISERHVHRR